MGRRGLISNCPAGLVSITGLEASRTKFTGTGTGVYYTLLSLILMFSMLQAGADDPATSAVDAETAYSQEQRLELDNAEADQQPADQGVTGSGDKSSTLSIPAAANTKQADSGSKNVAGPSLNTIAGGSSKV
jgi:hypothetical protein